MLKVVIADDEARVCRLVQMLADWDKLDMEVVGTAANGLEALELVEKLQPDILITDIRMPGCDGLELIRRVRELSGQLEIVIISGYAQFEYAQTAIRHDVGGYLLKPIKKDALMATLEKLGERCRKRSDSATAIEHLRRDSRKNQDLLRDRLMDDLCQGRLEAPTLARLREEYGFAAREGCFQVVVLKMDYDLDRFSGDSMLMIQKKAEEILQPAMEPLCFAAVLHFYDSAGYGVLNYDEARRDDVRRSLREGLNQLRAQEAFFGPVEFTLGIGRVTQVAGELPVSMAEARQAVAERLMEGTGRMLETALPPSQLQPRLLLDKYNRAVGHAVEALSAEEADKAVDELSQGVGQVAGVRGYELLDLVLAAGRMFAVRVSAEDDGAIRDFRGRCELCGNPGGLFGCLRGFQREQIEAVQTSRESEAIRPIRLAKQYVRQHYREPITLEDVCAAIGFSVSYFSTMFKKETGEGFSKYLTRVRIEQAKTLLQDTGLPVAEVCEQVGYNDLKHFTSNFKKLTGLNPGQYRKLYG